MNIFEELESNIRNYCRTFPDVFQSAKGSKLYSTTGKSYIDFFSGSGALNYGHNNENIKSRLIEYLEKDGIIHSLDMYTVAKEKFLQAFRSIILDKKEYPYKIQFCGPTGTNAVEAAIKLARKVTKRTGIFAFMGGYHGMSLGSLSVTSNHYHRQAAGVPLNNVTFFPYPGDNYKIDSINYIEQVLIDDHSGIEKPAAIIVETIQAEGGINIAPIEWLQALSNLCEEHDILLICDDIQVGCGRTGTFFSFEDAGIIPDLVVISKSISGYGMPMSILLMKKQHDIWSPGEHNGTFRGNQLAIVGATAALEQWEEIKFNNEIESKSTLVQSILVRDISSLDFNIKIRGKGLIWGIDFSQIPSKDIARKVRDRCFINGLIVECVGRQDNVIKILPPLNIETELLSKGCEVLKESVHEVLMKAPS
ncbi:diaminobutyrate--2-oxoglutarate transaminase [Paenibacillus sp. ClWae2A]|uniref:diaminobutyrate--2-oxoglutarate transaminase n=1 Tax=Paenibacillus sp. ClWae2A TaxID=3057177 RepID=UPI0028F58D1C|nr:diaminobutyrate--2-oxoglutarate transaminase [Paenibacillus sp. ClWae2A]MDT9722452.1 diaminobutyrate--2-oxoglutarate transaminase [Paenibacillus sp. ClWae2A]